MKQALLIINPVSGTSRKEGLEERVAERLGREGIAVTTRRTASADDATTFAREAVDKGFDMVLAAGGDGTVNETANALCGTGVAFGIIPCGSGNGLARHLNIPVDVRAALEIIAEGRTEVCDHGDVNGRNFFCTFGVGFDAAVSHKFAESKRRGKLTYLSNTFREYITYRPDEYVISANGEVITERAFVVAVCNASQYGNNAYIAPQASLTDGLMDVTILEPFTVLDVPSLSFQLFNKTIDQNSRIKTMRAKKIKIHRTKEGVMHYDGDPVMGGKDIEVELIPHGLNVIISNKKKEEEPFSLLQQIAEYFSGLKPKHEEMIKQKYNHLFVLNRHLLRRLSKK